MNGLMRFPKLADVEFAGTLAIALSFVGGFVYIIGSTFSGGIV